VAAAYGLGGRARIAGDPAERWRKAVTNQIRRTLERIRTGHPALGRHLDNALRTRRLLLVRPRAADHLAALTTGKRSRLSALECARITP
jgi:hypothetical protein